MLELDIDIVIHRLPWVLTQTSEVEIKRIRSNIIIKVIKKEVWKQWKAKFLEEVEYPQ